MSVLVETSKGDIVVDLYTKYSPKASQNFIKLCKIKYYNNCHVFNVQRNFLFQTGDPTGTGKGGDSIDGILYGDQARFFDDEIHPNLKHDKKGLLGMASAGKDKNASSFYITTGKDLYSLDDRRTIFGEVAEGMDVVDKINDAYCDDDGVPYQNVRIRHTIILDDPFEDPKLLEHYIPENSPPPKFSEGDRLEEDWVPTADARPHQEIQDDEREKEAQNRAVVLEMVGDLPEADVKPPSNMLFICKLNPVTTEEDLEIIFSRFGGVTSCDIIRDQKTSDSLCYGFLGFETDKQTEDAYFKMNNVLIDDRRIKVDFSQSVYHLWKQYKQLGKKQKRQDGNQQLDNMQPIKPQIKNDTYQKREVVDQKPLKRHRRESSQESLEFDRKQQKKNKYHKRDYQAEDERKQIKAKLKSNEHNHKHSSSSKDKHKKSKESKQDKKAKKHNNNYG